MKQDMSRFLNIWEVETHFKCPVIGAVLSIEKHKSILKKCGYDIKRMKPYEYHQQIMTKLSDENNVSVKVNNFIRNKAGKFMTRIAGISNNEVRQLWKKCLTTGDIGPMMYAIVSYKDTDIDLLHDVFGEVHMLCHANMTEIFRIRQKLVYAESKILKQNKTISFKNKNFKQLIKVKRSDDIEISMLHSENQKLRNRLSELENILDPETIQGSRISGMEHKIAGLKRKIAIDQGIICTMEREKRALGIDLLSKKSENELIKNELRSMITDFITCTSTICRNETACPDETACFNHTSCYNGNDCSGELTCPNEAVCIKEACPRYKLCAKRIFMIGGLTRMKSFYRDIVEKAGGKFDYHDGYLKNASINLKAKVKRCDIVLCPVNCNSHNACLRVKKLCNRYNKKLKFLNNSSLSAISKALFDKNAAM